MLNIRPGSRGIEVVTKDFRRTEALLEIPIRHLNELLRESGASFTLAAELPKSHPFERRSLHCMATFHAVLAVGQETAEILVGVRNLQFVPIERRPSQSRVRNCSRRRVS